MRINQKCQASRHPLAPDNRDFVTARTEWLSETDASPRSRRFTVNYTGGYWFRTPSKTLSAPLKDVSIAGACVYRDQVDAPTPIFRAFNQDGEIVRASGLLQLHTYPTRTTSENE